MFLEVDFTEPQITLITLIRGGERVERGYGDTDVGPL